jgi:hypothetical protein
LKFAFTFFLSVSYDGTPNFSSNIFFRQPPCPPLVRGKEKVDLSACRLLGRHRQAKRNNWKKKFDQKK